MHPHPSRSQDSAHYARHRISVWAAISPAPTSVRVAPTPSGSQRTQQRPATCSGSPSGRRPPGCLSRRAGARARRRPVPGRRSRRARLRVDRRPGPDRAGGGDQRAGPAGHPGDHDRPERRATRRPATGRAHRPGRDSATAADSARIRQPRALHRHDERACSPRRRNASLREHRTPAGRRVSEPPRA